MSEQDWTTVVLNKKNKTTNANYTPKSFKPATINTTKKIYNDDNTSDIVPVYIDKKLSTQIKTLRNKKNLSQKDLANKLQIPIDIIISYEKGTGIRNGHYVNKIKTFLEIDKNI